MSNSKLKLIEDVEFIFSEALRFKALERQWFETTECPEELRQAFLAEIKLSDGKRLTVGREAIRRLDNLAELAAVRAGIYRQVDIRTVREPLGKSLVRRFVTEARPIDLSQVERALSEAARKAARQRATITHYIPCHLMIAQEPERFAIGPISFLRRSEFRNVVAQKLWPLRSKHRRNWKFIGDALRYYKTFGWVAEVTVPECDQETSKAVAKQAVTAALNCLHLLFGAKHTRQMVIGGPAIQRDKRGELWIEQDALHFTASYGGPGSVAFQDNWTSLLTGDDAREVVMLCGVALEAAVDPLVERPLSSRFLDAAHWFGEAVREISPAAKVIKYVTALERMFMTDERDNIMDTVSQRVATFCSDPAVPGDFQKVEAQVRRAYDLRSKLAHGSMSPRDDAVYEGVRIGAQVGRDALLSGLNAFQSHGLRQEGVRSKQIAQWFQSWVGHFARVRDRIYDTCPP